MSGQTKKTPENWTKNVLLGSVALNVFLAGFLFAKVLGPAPGAPSSEPPLVSFSSLPVDIPASLREELETSFRPHQKEIRKTYRDLMTARINVRDILESKEFNEIDLEAALANIRDLQIRIQGPMHAALVEAARDLDFETRRKLSILGERFEGQGDWELKRIDGARWRVEFGDGEFVLEFQGINDREDGYFFFGDADDEDGAE